MLTNVIAAWIMFRGSVLFFLCYRYILHWSHRGGVDGGPTKCRALTLETRVCILSLVCGSALANIVLQNLKLWGKKEDFTDMFSINIFATCQIR